MSFVNLQNLAFNILKETKHSAVQNIDVTELPPCKLCENKILSINFKSFTILSCGHIYHRKCIEKKFLLTTENKCPLSDCNKIIDPVVSERKFSESSSQSSGTSALADILGKDFGLGSPINVSLLLGQKEPLLNETAQKKCIIESLYKSDKRQKSTTKESESSTVKKLIKELKDDSINKDLIFPSQLSENSYTYLYKEIVKAEANNNIASQKLLNYYFQFEVNDTTRWKQTERAKKIYKLFIEIGIDKMEWVKSYLALTISKLSWESINYIVDNIKS
ncbi:41312_t:CDS:2 [Gigaspora margarita]|uniref:41312_t:CDS:1 n=1 Tax=Gigaspora margarita TaxID=4874 RepID=A0ABM8W719_GIGMA|nr:41312_t:CDS:2 [Gigaspora margarita]